MQAVRKEALIEAAIAEIGTRGALDVTMGAVARRAGVSSALAHHYFGNKDTLFLAAMRQILTVFGAGVRCELAASRSQKARVEAIIRASFAEENFDPTTIAAWLTFYVRAQTSASVRRLLHLYQARLHSNLRYGLYGLVADHRVEWTARGIAAMIDGFYIRQALRPADRERAATEATVRGYLEAQIARDTNHGEA